MLGFAEVAAAAPQDAARAKNNDLMKSIVRNNSNSAEYLRQRTYSIFLFHEIYGV
jgi:hypothetical protein